jgi:hypothetical protein
LGHGQSGWVDNGFTAAALLLRSERRVRPLIENAIGIAVSRQDRARRTDRSLAADDAEAL